MLGGERGHGQICAAKCVRINGIFGLMTVFGAALMTVSSSGHSKRANPGVLEVKYGSTAAVRQLFRGFRV